MLIINCSLNAKLIKITAEVINSSPSSPDDVHSLKLLGAGVSTQSHPWKFWYRMVETNTKSRRRIEVQVEVLAKQEYRPLSTITIYVTDLRHWTKDRMNFSRYAEGAVVHKPFQSTHADAARKKARTIGSLGRGNPAGDACIRGTVVAMDFVDDKIYRHLDSLIVPKRWGGGNCATVLLDDTKGSLAYVLLPAMGSMQMIGERFTFTNLQEVGAILRNEVNGERKAITVYSNLPIEGKYITKSTVPIVVQPDNIPSFEPKEYDKKPYKIKSLADLNNEELWKENKYMSIEMSLEEFVFMMNNGLSRTRKAEIPIGSEMVRVVPLDGIPEGMITSMLTFSNGRMRATRTEGLFGKKLSMSVDFPGRQALVFGLSNDLAGRFVGVGVPATITERPVKEIVFGLFNAPNLKSITLTISKSSYTAFAKSGMSFSGGQYSRLGYKNDGELGIQKGVRGASFTIGSTHCFQCIVDDIFFKFIESGDTDKVRLRAEKAKLALADRLKRAKRGGASEEDDGFPTQKK